MSLCSIDCQWGSVVKFFYWIMVLVILVNGVWGLLMIDMMLLMSKISVYVWYKLIGFMVLVLFVLWLVWCVFDCCLKDEFGLCWQQLVVYVVYGVLYLMIVVLLFIGWWFNLLCGFLLQYFKLFNLLVIVGKNEEFVYFVYEVYEFLFWVLLLVLVVYVGVVFKYYVFDNDNVLCWMLLFGCFCN